jgi:transposase
MSRFQLLSDAQSELIAGLLPARMGKRGRPFRDARQIVHGLIYRYRCGIDWRDVPEVFGPWQTIWTWHRRLGEDGTWDAVLAQLLSAGRGGWDTGRWQWIPRSLVPISTPRTSPATQGLGRITRTRASSRLTRALAVPAAV